MTYAPPKQSLLVAPVGGMSAHVLTRLLPDRAELLEKTAALHPQDRAAIMGTYDAIRAAAAVWDLQRREMAGPNSRPVETEKAPQIRTIQPTTAHLSVEEAAASLGLSARRVRQLLNTGTLEGQMVSHRWLVSASSVEGYRIAKEVA